MEKEDVLDREVQQRSAREADLLDQNPDHVCLEDEAKGHPVQKLEKRFQGCKDKLLFR